MNLIEIQERANDYRTLLSNPKMLREQRRSAALAQQAEKATRRPRRDLSERAHELLDGIDAISCLKAIRDEAWKEGKFVEFGRTMIDGRKTEWVVRLESDPFYAILPIVIEDKRAKVEKLELKEETAFLDVAVRVQTGRVPYITINGDGIYNRSSNTTLNFQENVKEQGLQRALSYVSLDYHLEGYHEINWSGFNPTRPLAQDELCLRLNDILRIMRNTHSFPFQIRQLCDELTKQFPASLKERGEMTQGELREWEYKIRETPRWLRFFDRRLGFLG